MQDAFLLCQRKGNGLTRSPSVLAERAFTHQPLAMLRHVCPKTPSPEITETVTHIKKITTCITNSYI